MNVHVERAAHRRSQAAASRHLRQRPQTVERLLYEALRSAVLRAQSSRQQRGDAPVQQEMHFFSFGFYHHDLCLVKHHKLKMDNNSMLHFTLVARDATAFDGDSRPRRRDGHSGRATAA